MVYLVVLNLTVISLTVKVLSNNSLFLISKARLSQKLRTALKFSEGVRIAENNTEENIINGNNNATALKNQEKKGGSTATTTTTTIIKQQKNSMEGDIPQLGLHASFFVEGIKIGWPFPAIMLPQRQMAIHIIKGLKRKLHVVLESPTGTGKSVAILCSVLAWQRYHAQTFGTKNDNHYNNTDGGGDDDDGHGGTPKIIYCSRTHSQVAQMVASLKKTPYRPKMTVLGSRERLCIHKELTGANRKKNKTPINIACQDRKGNTETERKRLKKDHNFEYDDDDPRPPERNGDGSGEDYFLEDDTAADTEGAGNGEVAGRQNKSSPTCPHYRQLSSERTAKMVAKQFVGSRISHNTCCSSSTVGGEESAFGVHDMEDLVRFGKNPYKEENIAVYRAETGKFGFLVNNNIDNKGITTKGCHVVSLVDGGAANFESRLQNGDNILQVNGKDVRSWNKAKVVEILSQTPKDQPARLNVLRDTADTPKLLDATKDVVATGRIVNGQGDTETAAPEESYSKHSVCPYYISRAIQPHAELTFAPYNYILDPGIRRAMNISLKNAVVVLDEAHNVESTLCEVN